MWVLHHVKARVEHGELGWVALHTRSKDMAACCSAIVRPWLALGSPMRIEVYNMLFSPCNGGMEGSLGLIWLDFCAWDKNSQFAISQVNWILTCLGILISEMFIIMGPQCQNWTTSTACGHSVQIHDLNCTHSMTTYTLNLFPDPQYSTCTWQRRVWGMNLPKH